LTWKNLLVRDLAAVRRDHSNCRTNKRGAALPFRRFSIKFLTDCAAEKQTSENKSGGTNNGDPEPD